MALLDRRDRRRGQFATFLAEILAAAGRGVEAQPVLDEAYGVGRARGDVLTLAYCAWVRAECASHQGDEAEVRRQLSEVERHSGPWYEHSTGTDFETAAAEMWRRLGHENEAERCLSRVAGRPVGTTNAVLIARGAHLARFGDPIEAEQVLAEALESGDTRRVMVPRIEALRALAALRRGDRVGAELSLRRAEQLGADMGAPAMVAIVESYAVNAVRRLHRADTDLAPDVDTGAARRGRDRSAPSVEIRLLGRFEVLVNGSPRVLPAGQASELVKRLAIARGPLADEQILDALWPDADLATARRRLRNLLNRVRESAGEVIVRRDAALALPALTRIDAYQLLDAIEGARRDGRDLRAMERAIAIAAGPLLPDDRYADWAVALREQCTAAVVGALHNLADASTMAGDPERALLFALRAVELQPFDDALYVLAARAAVAGNQRGLAASLVERGRHMLADLGVPVSADLAELMQP